VSWEMEEGGGFNWWTFGLIFKLRTWKVRAGKDAHPTLLAAGLSFALGAMPLARETLCIVPQFG
jgi:hypothetical protein